MRIESLSVLGKENFEGSVHSGTSAMWDGSSADKYLYREIVKLLPENVDREDFFRFSRHRNSIYPVCMATAMGPKYLVQQLRF